MQKKVKKNRVLLFAPKSVAVDDGNEMDRKDTVDDETSSECTRRRRGVR